MGPEARVKLTAMEILNIRWKYRMVLRESRSRASSIKTWCIPDSWYTSGRLDYIAKSYVQTEGNREGPNRPVHGCWKERFDTEHTPTAGVSIRGNKKWT